MKTQQLYDLKRAHTYTETHTEKQHTRARRRKQTRIYVRIYIERKLIKRMKDSIEITFQV